MTKRYAHAPAAHHLVAVESLDAFDTTDTDIIPMPEPSDPEAMRG